MPVEAAFDHEYVVTDEEDSGGENADDGDGDDREASVGSVYRGAEERDRWALGGRESGQIH